MCAGEFSHEQDYAHDHERRRHDGVGARDHARKRMAHRAGPAHHQDEQERAEQFP